MVKPARVRLSSSVFAIPKSISFTVPLEVTWMFSGLISRWMILCWWMYSSALAT